MREFKLKYLMATPGVVHTGLIAAASLCIVAPAHAQGVASVAAIQRVTEKRSGESAWKPANVGAPLKIDDAFRTGKRSKADIKFRDGSLVRLGQLSSIEFGSSKGVTLMGGQLLYVALKPGRVLAGTAAAEIKGSSLAIRRNPDGTVDAELISGAVTITSPLGSVDLKPGQGVSVAADGTISPVRVASPADYLRGFTRSELYDAPVNSPFVGSKTNELVRLTPERLSLDDYDGIGTDDDIVDDFNPFNFRNNRVSPFPPAIPPVLPPLPTSPILAGAADGQKIAGPGITARQAVDADVARGTDAATDLTDMSTRDAERHYNERDSSLGSTFGGDAYGVSIFGNGGTRIIGGRVHGYAARGKLFFDIAAQPLRVRFADNSSSNWSSIPSAYINYRDTWGDIQVGRQRFVAGPTQATLYGSMVRAGTREIMDAVRFAPKLKPGRTFEVAYLQDAFPRFLPYRIGGQQHGWYGRAGAQEKFGNFGLNVLRYDNAPVSSTTGVTFDFALPVVRNKIELYGEIGRDPFRRKLRTVGLTFPGLYERTGLETFLEYADLNSSSVYAGPPTELTARVFRKVNKNLNVVASLSRFYGSGTSFLLGVSYGGRITKTGDSYSTPESM